MVANLNRGTTTWEDTKYVVGSSSTKIFLRYDVRAYYSIEGTMSTPEPIALNGNLLSKDTGEKDNNMGITAFAIDNFPNPFNPTTTVNYQMPYGGLVKIKVFDMLGKEIAELVNSLKDSGSYNVKFDGGNLASGTYLVHIQVTLADVTKSGYVKTKKMILLK